MSQCIAKSPSGLRCERRGGHWSEHRSGEIEWDDIEAELKKKQAADRAKQAFLDRAAIACMAARRANGQVDRADVLASMAVEDAHALWAARQGEG